MARTKEFDPAKALDDAMRLFWDRGYDGTSTADLVSGTGVARASLYATFGSKRELYLACLDHYLTGAGLPTPEEVAAEADGGLAAVRALMQAAAHGMGDQGAPAGCFSVNATVEHGNVDPEIARRLEANRVRFESTLRGALLRARREGQVRADLDIDGAASMLFALTTGLRAVARAGSGQRQRLDAAVTTAMGLIAN